MTSIDTSKLDAGADPESMTLEAVQAEFREAI
jgi:hypothetical protein